MDVNRSGVADPTFTPGPVEQLLSAEYDTDVLAQEGEQAKLLSRKSDGITINGCFMPFKIDRYGAELCGYSSGLDSPTPQDGLDSRHDLARGERLGHIVVSAEFETENPIDLIIASGQKQYGNVTRCSDLSADIEAGHAREANIEHDEVWLP